MPYKAVILDRDGVINEDTNYTYKVEDLKLIPGSAEAIKLLNDAGYTVFVVSNQSGIGRKYYTKEDMINFNTELRKQIYEVSGGKIEKFKCCPHKPDDNCKCRKPSTYFYRKLMNHYGFNPDDAYCIGDKDTDLIPADKLGITPILVLTGHGEEYNKGEYISCRNLLSAVTNIILRKEVVLENEE